MTQRFLYGASVQGIQDFSFQTNELKDIVGASELVEKICTDLFSRYKAHGELVVNAAGNVKCVFSNREECEKAVKSFPKTVMEYAPGITISQAVVKLRPDEGTFKDYVEELERRLRVQRSKPQRRVTLGTMAMLRSRTTGLPVVEKLISEGKDIEYLDEGTCKKRTQNKDNSTFTLAKIFFGNKDLTYKSIAFNIEDLTDKNNWIAIIHVDGNGLGQVVAQKNKNTTELKAFSDKLNEATEYAAQQAYKEIIKDTGFEPTTNVIPFRPVVLGGDDMTVICRADLAMRFTHAYIRHFEDNTRINGDPLTACAGIAYMKSSYPFHYGYALAETLCEEAKKDAKCDDHLRDGLAPSCIMFHKIQGSYIGAFKQIEDDELTINKDNSLKFGPYYLEPMESRWTVDDLRDAAANLNKKDDNGNSNAAKTDIRQWLTLMHEDTNKADQKRNRVRQISSDNIWKSFDNATRKRKRGNMSVYPAFDILQLLTVETQITKHKDEKH